MYYPAGSRCELIHVNAAQMKSSTAPAHLIVVVVD